MRTLFTFSHGRFLTGTLEKRHKQHIKQLCYWRLKESAEAFFAHLCTLVDKGSTTEEVNARLIIVVKQIIIDGKFVSS